MGLLTSLAGWWRPEGFVMGVLIVAAMAAAVIKRDQIRLLCAGKTLLALVVGLAIPFILWVAFRLAYFGHLLPSSAVMKSGGFTRANGLESFQFYVLMLLPILAVVAFGGLVARSRVIVFIGLLVAASAMWVPVSMDLNWWNRMQWPLVPALAIISMFAVVKRRTMRFDFGTKPLEILNILGGIFLAIALITVTRAYGLQGAPYTA